MSNQTSLTDHRLSPVLIWSGLTTEHQSRVIRLMAQLAFKLVVAQPNSALKEVNHAAASEQTQNRS